MSTIKYYNQTTGQWEYLTNIMIGPTGPSGPTGAKGADGQGLTIKGTLPNTGALPSSGNEAGDAYLIAGALYIWDGSAWQNVGNIQGYTGPSGPRGYTGATGAQGTQGNTGMTGAMGPSGPTGPLGEQGYTGPQGSTGPTGPQGEPGNDGSIGPEGATGPAGTSVTILGTLNDESELPPTGNSNGDGYLIDGELWVWSGSEWVNVGNIAGPTGPSGAAGPTGATGPSGPAVFVSASEPPAPTGATDTMLWFDTDDETAITLPAGPTGPNGATGATGPVSTVPGYTGATGPQGTTGPTGPVGPTGPASTPTWGGITGAISSQTDLVDYIAENAPAPTPVTVTTANGTAAKVGTTTAGTYVPAEGDEIEVNFVNGSNVNNPTLNIDGSGAVNIRLGQTNASTATMGLGTGANSNIKIRMFFDGTYWQLYGANDNTNTTYTGIAATPATATGSTQALAINRMYISTYAGEINFTLPASAAVGSLVAVTSIDAGGWRVTAPSGDNIIMQGFDTGAAGYITGGQYDTVYLRCIVANTTWVVDGFTGRIQNNNGDVISNQTAIIFNEAPTGTVDGVNTVFTIASPASNIFLTLNGLVMRPGTGNDYTFSGNTITFEYAPPTGSQILVTYTKTVNANVFGSNSFVPKETPGGSVNGSNANFTTSQSYIGGSLEVWVNGLRQAVAHVTETGANTFTLDAAPLTGDIVEVSYMVSAAASYNADTVDNYHANATPTANTILPLNSSAQFNYSAVKVSPGMLLAKATPPNSFSSTSSTPAYVTDSNLTFTAPAGCTDVILNVEAAVTGAGTGTSRQWVVELRDALNAGGNVVIRRVATTALTYSDAAMSFPISVTPGQTYNFSLAFRTSTNTTTMGFDTSSTPALWAVTA